MQVSTLFAEAAIDGEIAAQQGSSLLDNPYRCCRELSHHWQVAFIESSAEKALSLHQGRDIPPAREYQRKPKPGEIEAMCPLHQIPSL